MPKEKDTIKILLNTKTYPKEAIVGASYVFIDRAYIFLDNPEKDSMAVSLKSKKNISEKKLEELKGEFHNELLNYVHRINIAKANKKIREYIVERALFASVENESGSTGGDAGFDDPLGIAVPWEEKYGEGKK